MNSWMSMRAWRTFTKTIHLFKRENKGSQMHPLNQFKLQEMGLRSLKIYQRAKLWQRVLTFQSEKSSLIRSKNSNSKLCKTFTGLLSTIIMLHQPETLTLSKRLKLIWQPLAKSRERRMTLNAGLAETLFARCQ